MTAEFGSRFVYSDGMRLHVEDSGGNLAPVVMLHGGGPGASARSNYERNVKALSAVGRLILIDLPGYGRSDKPELSGPRLAFFAGHVRRVLDALSIDRADFIGNSLGGAVATKLALDTPDRVRRLVLMGPAIGFPVFGPFPTEGMRHMGGYYAGEGPTPEKMRALVNVMVHDPAGVSDDLVAERYAASTQPDVLAAPLNPPGPKAPFEQLWPEVGRIAHPTLLLWGRDDRVVPFDSAFVVFKQLRDAELHVFAETGHWVQWERAAAFNRLAAEFLTRP